MNTILIGSIAMGIALFFIFIVIPVGRSLYDKWWEDWREEVGSEFSAVGEGMEREFFEVVFVYHPPLGVISDTIPIPYQVIPPVVLYRAVTYFFVQNGLLHLLLLWKEFEAEWYYRRETDNDPMTEMEVHPFNVVAETLCQSAQGRGHPYGLSASIGISGWYVQVIGSDLHWVRRATDEEKVFPH